MTLVVEDGTGLDTAESYISATDADTYHALRGNTPWAALADADKEIALRKATEYLDARYGARWKGARTVSSQALGWPRQNAELPDECGYYPSDALPIPLVRATAEAALLSLTETFWLPTDPATIVESTSEKVDVLEEKKTYRKLPVGSSTEKKYPILDVLLRPLLAYGTGTVRLVRS